MDSYRKIINELYTDAGFDRIMLIGRHKHVICYYCGSIASGQDHVPPLSVVRDLILENKWNDIAQYQLVRVPCCDFCNIKLSNKPLMTPNIRKEYIENNTAEIIPHINPKRGRKKSPKGRYGYYVSLSIMDIANAIKTFQYNKNINATKNVSILLRTIMEEWIEYNNTRTIDTIEDAKEVLMRYGIPIGNQGDKE